MTDVAAFVVSSAAVGSVVTAIGSGWQSRRTARVAWRRDQLAAKYVALSEAAYELTQFLAIDIDNGLQEQPISSLDKEFAAHRNIDKTLRVAAEQVLVVGERHTRAALVQLLDHLSDAAPFFPCTAGGGVATVSARDRAAALRLLTDLHGNLTLSMRRDLGLLPSRWHRRRWQHEKWWREEQKRLQDRIQDHRHDRDPWSHDESALVEWLVRYGCHSTGGQGFDTDVQEFETASAAIVPGRTHAALVLVRPGAEPLVMVRSDLSPGEHLEALRRVTKLVRGNFRPATMTWKALPDGARAYLLLRADAHAEDPG